MRDMRAQTPGIWARVKGALRRAWAGEHAADWPGEPVDPLDLYDGVKGVEWAAGLLRRVLRRGGRGGGPQQPTTLTDQRVRELARLLEKYNPYAQGMLSALQSYVLGDQGLQVEVVCRPGDKPDNALRCQAQAYLDEFRDREDWWNREREVYRRAHRDGEATLRYFYSADTGVRVRPVEPECIVPPDAKPEWSGGVRTDPDDVETREALWVQDDPAVEGEEVPFAEVYMIACNVDRCEKRGLSDFASVAPLLQEAIDLVRTMLQAEAERQSIVFVTHHKNSTPADVEEHARRVAAMSDYTPPPVAQSAQTVPTQYKRGKGIQERHLSGEQELAAIPDPKSVESAISAVNTALLAVGVRYHMPLWVISGDASRNNALDLGAEGPFGRFIADEQQWFCRHIRNVLWRVIQVGVEEDDLPADVLEAVDLTVSPQKPAEKRDPKQETERLSLLNEKGILGPSSWAAKEGLDFEAEQRDIQRHPPPGAQAPGGPAAPGIPAPGNPAPAPGGNGQGKNYFEAAGDDGADAQPRRGKWRLVQESGTGVLAEFDEGVGDDLLWAGEAQSRGQPDNAGQFGPGGGGGGKKEKGKGKAGPAIKSAVAKENEIHGGGKYTLERPSGGRWDNPTGKAVEGQMLAVAAEGRDKHEVAIAYDLKLGYASLMMAAPGSDAAHTASARVNIDGAVDLEGVGNRTARVYPEDPPALAQAKVAFALGKKGAKSPDGKRKWDKQPLPAVAEEFLWAGEVQSRGQPENAGQFGPGGGGGKKEKKGKEKKEKEEKPTIAAMVEHIAGLRAGKPTAAHLSDLAAKLGKMTVKDLHVLKTELGGKGGKTKPEIVAKIQAAVTGTPAAKPPAKAPAAKKAPAGKTPPAARPTVEDMAKHIEGLRAAGPPTAAHLDDLAQKLGALTVKDLHVLKTQLGAKGGKTKPEVVAKIRAAVAGAPAAKPPPAGKKPAAGKPTAKPAGGTAPPEPGFSGKDSQGREWRNGELVAGAEKPPASGAGSLANRFFEDLKHVGDSNGNAHDVEAARQTIREVEAALPGMGKADLLDVLSQSYGQQWDKVKGDMARLPATALRAKVLTNYQGALGAVVRGQESAFGPGPDAKPSNPRAQPTAPASKAVPPAPAPPAAKPAGTAPAPPKPGFSGKDSQGRTWQDGKLVAATEKPPAGATPAMTPTGHPAIDQAIATATTPTARAQAVFDSAKHYGLLRVAGHADGDALVRRDMAAALAGQSPAELRATAAAMGMTAPRGTPEELRQELIERAAGRVGGTMRAYQQYRPAEAKARAQAELEKAGYNAAKTPAAKPAGAPAPPEPGFTGKDSQGRTWQGGKLVAKAEKPPAPARSALPKGFSAVVDDPKEGLLVGRNAAGDLHTAVEPSADAYRRLVGGLRHAMEEATLYRDFQDGVVPIPKIVELVKQKVPDATAGEVYSALLHASDAKALELHKLNEVHQVGKDAATPALPQGAAASGIYRNGRLHYYAVLPAGRTAQQALTPPARLTQEP